MDNVLRQWANNQGLTDRNGNIDIVGSVRDRMEAQSEGGAKAPPPAADAGASLEDTLTAMDHAFDLEQQAVEANLARFPRTVDISLSEAIKSGASLNEAMSQQLFASLEKIDPNWRENVFGAYQESMAQAKNVVTGYLENLYPEAMRQGSELAGTVSQRAKEYLTGVIPSDVLAQNRRLVSESSVLGASATAQRGTANMMKQLYGITDARIQTGAGMAQLSSGLYSAQSALAGSAVNLAGSLGTMAGNYGSLLQGFSPRADLSALFTTNQGVLAGGTITNPSQSSATFASMYGKALDTQYSYDALNANLAYQREADQKSYDAAIYGSNMMLQAANSTNRANRQNSWMNLLGTVGTIAAFA